jgi:hypothetical protein
MSDEKMAFIKGSVPPVVEAAETPTPKVPLVEPAESLELNAETSSARAVPMPLLNEEPDIDAKAPSGQPQRRSRVRNSRREHANAEEGMAGMVNLLVPLTTRLTPVVATALKRAGLEQKLYGRKPSTVQEIAEEAIKSWLESEGYL